MEKTQRSTQGHDGVFGLLTEKWNEFSACALKKTRKISGCIISECIANTREPH